MFRVVYGECNMSRTGQTTGPGPVRSGLGAGEMGRERVREGSEASPEQGPDPEGCSNVEEYIMERLADAEESVSPADVTREYGCSAGHVQHAFSDLAAEGKVERVDVGEYTLPTPEDTAESGPEDSENGGGSGEETNEDQGESQGVNMVTQAEYARQQAGTGHVFEGGDSENRISERGAGNGGENTVNRPENTENGGERSPDTGPEKVPVEVVEGRSIPPEVPPGKALVVATAIFAAVVIVVAWKARDQEGGADQESEQEEQERPETPLLEG